MSHNHHEAKSLQRILQARESEHKDSLMSITEKIALLKSSVGEAHAFLEQGNTIEACRALAETYSDADRLIKHINVIAAGSMG